MRELTAGTVSRPLSRELNTRTFLVTFHFRGNPDFRYALPQADFRQGDFEPALSRVHHSDSALFRNSFPSLHGYRFREKAGWLSLPHRSGNAQLPETLKQNGATSAGDRECKRIQHVPAETDRINSSQKRKP